MQVPKVSNWLVRSCVRGVFCLYSQTKRFLHESGRTEAFDIMQRLWNYGLWVGRSGNMKSINTIESHSRFERKEMGWQRWIGLHKELERKLMPWCQCTIVAITKIPLTGQLINSRHLLLTILEAGSSVAMHWQICCLLRAHFWFTDGHLLSLSSHGRMNKRVLWASFFERALILFMRAPFTSQMPHLLLPSHWRLRYNT